MAIKTHKVTLSLDNPRVIQSGINVQSFDKQSIQISIELTKNDEVFQVPSDATIRVSLLKLARQEQKIIVDVPNTNRESIDWIVPDYLDGYQGTVRVGVYLVSGAENVDLGYFTILSNVSDIDKMADEFTDNVFQGWEQIEADLNELNLTIAQTKLDLADDLTQIDSTIAHINTLASDFTADVATKQADVTSKYNAFDTDITEANQTIDDILALQPQFQSVLDETTGKDVISAPEIILARGGAQTLGERLDSEKAEVSAQLQQMAINVKTFGAKGDGITIDTKAIQNAFIYAYKNKKSVYFPNGIYIIDKPILIIANSSELVSSVDVQGENLENTVIKPHSTFNAHLGTGLLSNKSMFIIVNETYLNANDTFKNGTGSTHSVFISNFYLLGEETNNVDYGILFATTNASSTYRQLRIRGFNVAGMKNMGNFYLNMLEKVRIDKTPTSFDFSTGINTSLKIDSCYSVTATVAGFKVQGTYMTMINPAVDGCSGTCYDLRGYTGSVISPGAESISAQIVFRGGQYTNVSVISPYTLGNFTSDAAWHISLANGAYMIFRDGSMLIDQTGTDRVSLGGLVNHGTLSYVSFENVKIGKYTKNSEYKDTMSSKEYKTRLGRINTRYGDNLSYVGFDGGSGNTQTNNADSKNGWVDVEATSKVVLGNGLFFGFGNSIGYTDDGKDIRYNSGFVKGDILLTRKPKDIGGAGWIVTENTTDVNGAVSNNLKIPVIMSGTTAERPYWGRMSVGQMYFDTTLFKPVWYKGSNAWVDATGTSV